MRCLLLSVCGLFLGEMQRIAFRLIIIIIIIIIIIEFI